MVVAVLLLVVLWCTVGEKEEEDGHLLPFAPLLCLLCLLAGCGGSVGVLLRHLLLKEGVVH